MNAEDVIESHPLRLLDGHKALPDGEVSLLLARSGVGKSAALINFALEEILQGNHVYHYSAGMPSEKTHQYYQKILGDYRRYYHPSREATWEQVYHHFTVISYLDPDKMIDDLEMETQTILSSTDIKPSLIIVDGLDYSGSMTQSLTALSKVAKENQTKVLASMRVHRTSEGGVDLAGPVDAVWSFTDHIYFLEPDPAHDRINLELVTKDDTELLPVFFCPHDFVFKAD